MAENTEDSEEELGMNPDEFIDWLCWERVITAVDSYPPKETAKEYIERLEDAEEVEVNEERLEAMYNEKFLEAVDKLVILHRNGYDIIQRAERERVMPEIDYSFLEDCPLLPEVPEDNDN